MKKHILITGLLLLGLCLSFQNAEAQSGLLKSVQNQTKKQVKRTVDQKVTKGVNKSVNNADKAITNTAKNAVNGNSSSNTKTSNSGTTTTTTNSTKVRSGDPNADPIIDTNPHSDPVGVGTNALDEDPGFDFVPGTSIVFSDFQAADEAGEFPKNWTLNAGGFEVGTFDGAKAIKFTGSPTEMSPKMDGSLPPAFTLEFDAYFHNDGYEIFYIKLDGMKDIAIHLNKAEMGNFNGTCRYQMTEAGWRRVSLSYNSRAIKVYLDKNRVLNIPNMNDNPTSFRIAALSGSAAKGNPSMVRNIKLARN